MILKNMINTCLQNHYINFFIKNIFLPFLLTPINSLTKNLPYPLITISSFKFISLDDLISTFEFTLTLSAFKISSVLLLDTFAISDT